MKLSAGVIAMLVSCQTPPPIELTLLATEILEPTSPGVAEPAELGVLPSLLYPALSRPSRPPRFGDPDYCPGCGMG